MGKSKSKKVEEPVIVPKIEPPKEIKVYQPLYKAISEDVVIKPWGSYATIDNGPGWKAKKIQINPGLLLREKACYLLEIAASIEICLQVMLLLLL